MYQPLDGSVQHAKRRGIHWKAPTVMVVSFVLGAIFIAGHHFFYQSLHHTPTGDAIFQQQIGTGIGTAFAFIVKMFLVISVATGYWQVFWHQVKKRPVTIERIDVLSSVLGNALQFCSVRTFGRFPTLALIEKIDFWVIHLNTL